MEILLPKYALKSIYLQTLNDEVSPLMIDFFNRNLIV